MPTSLLFTAALFVVAGVLHFVIPRTYVGIMPSWLPAWLPSPLMLVYLSGVFEALGGVGLLLPATRLAAAIGLIVLLAAVLPANVEMLRRRLAAPARSSSRPYGFGCRYNHC